MIYLHHMTGKRYQQRGENAELDLLRIKMIQRGLTYRDLAAKVGRKPQRIANVLSGSDRTWPIRSDINRALRSKVFRKPKNTRRQRPRHTKT